MSAAKELSFTAAEMDDDDDDNAPDPETCDLDEAISYALGSLEADALDVLDECATRYEREREKDRAELAELRAAIKLDRAAFNAVLMAVQNASRHLSEDAAYNSTACEFIEQLDFAEMLLSGAERKTKPIENQKDPKQ